MKSKLCLAIVVAAATLGCTPECEGPDPAGMRCCAVNRSYAGAVGNFQYAQNCDLAIGGEVHMDRCKCR